jgi:hypothetical protein
VKSTFVPETPDIYFERFKFNTLPVRNILKRQCGEIRLTGLRTQTCKLRNADSDGIITLWLGVWKQFQFPTGLGNHNLLQENNNSPGI